MGRAWPARIPFLTWPQSEGCPREEGVDDFWWKKIARGDARWRPIMFGSAFADTNFYKGFLSCCSGHQGRVVFLRVLRFPPTERPSELFIFKNFWIGKQPLFLNFFKKS